MHVTLAHIGTKFSAKEGYEELVALYLARCAPFARCQAETFRTEDAFLQWLDRQQGRTPVVVVLLDSRGREMTSDGFAHWLGSQRDSGAQHIVFAIGPASGWSNPTRKRATLLLSLGQMTMAHALARVVIAEQIYRAFTILTGHPYHTGH